MSSIDDILKCWREEHVPLNPGASALQLESLERLLGVPLSSDLRNFYVAANGMEDYRHDSRMVSMWSIERAVRERNIHEGEDEWGEFRDIAFADVIFSAWHFCYRVRSEGPIRVIAGLTHEELPSLYAVFDAIMRRPDSLSLGGSSKANAGDRAA